MSCGKGGAPVPSLGQEKTGNETNDKTPDSISAKALCSVTCKLTSLRLDLRRGHHNQGDEHQSIDNHVQTKIDETVYGDRAKTKHCSKTDSAGKVICRAKVY